MKYQILLFILSFSFIILNAQEQKLGESNINWMHKDVEESGVFGVGSDAAMSFLKSKKIKPVSVIVGVIDSGVDIEHEDLKENIWINPNEKPGNGIDDDNNGYVDDINGWDFLGNKDGKDISKDTYEATRIVVMFENLFDSNDRDKNLINIKKYPEKYQIYLKARKNWADKYYKSYSKLESIKVDEAEAFSYLELLKKHLKDKKLTKELIEIESEKNDNLFQLKDRILKLLSFRPELSGKTIDELINLFKIDYSQMREHFGNSAAYAYNKEFNPRDIIDDDFSNKRERGYGNNEVEGPDALHGTHVAGIIAAKRNNNIGMNGIAGNIAKIMAIRAVPDGDERDKDVANAIRYAVDNGAKIINMSFGKGYSPEKELVWDAIRYADKAGVLMFHAAGNGNLNIDLDDAFPTNFVDKSMESFAKNWITVGASTRHVKSPKASFSNFGRARVDIFAPGLEIYATIPNNQYRLLQGTSMASPVAAACAAILWAYFPHLTSQEVKHLLLKNVNVVNTIVDAGNENDKKKFSDLSVTGGIIDVYKAVKEAYSLYGRPKKRN